MNNTITTSEIIALNLKNIKRKDHTVIQTQCIASHVVLYNYQELVGWEKLECEGPLFLSIKVDNQYTLYIMNRLNPEDFMMEINSSREAEDTIENTPTLLIYTGHDQTSGLWFHSKQEKDFCFEHLQSILDAMQHTTPVPPMLTGQTERSQVDAMNFKNMYRADQTVKHTECVGAHVVAYQFDEEKQAWGKLDLEGPLFLNARENGQFTLVIMNRQDLSDFRLTIVPNIVQSLEEQDTIENTESLLVYKQAGQIWGIWFHLLEQKDKLYTILQRIHRI